MLEKSTIQNVPFDSQGKIFHSNYLAYIII